MILVLTNIANISACTSLEFFKGYRLKLAKVQVCSKLFTHASLIAVLIAGL